MGQARNSRADVVKAAGRLFAERGYHGTSMRDLGRELGLLGGSLYAHVESKQDLLVEVVQQGAELFEAVASRALATEGTAADRLRAFIDGHVGVVVDNLDVVRTYLNEARVLDDEHRARVLEARDRYEAVLRKILADGATDGSFGPGVDKIDAIFILSILNAVERWYDPEGPVDRAELTARVLGFVLDGIGAGLVARRPG
ncbi:MAG: TetR family transcriptional regulator [Actinomycetes bacterium]|jgi:AcrR family transcriptional regulator|nr:MAG: TetR/AcrR family transcriptional regulator [Actinomycetota bacterium]